MLANSIGATSIGDGLRRWRGLAALIGAASVLAVAGCGGDEESSTGAATSGQPLAGKTVGFSVQLAANVTLGAIGEGLTAEVERQGGELKILDAQGKPEKQLTDIKQFIAQDVDALVVHPAAWESVRGVLRQAERQGIPIVAHDAIFGNPSKDDLRPVQVQVNEGRATQAAEAAKLLTAEGADGGIIAMTFCPNPPTHQYLMAQAAEQLAAAGAKVLDTVCNPTDDTSGAFGVAQRALTRFGSAGGVYAYNDSSAVGFAKAAANAGRDGLVITGYNAEPHGIAAVKQGEIAATWDYRPVEIGQTLARAAGMIIAGEGDRLPSTVTVEPKMITKSNVAEFVPWDERVMRVKQGDYIGVPLDK